MLAKKCSLEKTKRDPLYLVWMRTQPCTKCGLVSFYMGTHAHHVATGGMGIKCDDDRSIPLCNEHHAQIHNGMKKSGWWTQEELDEIIAKLKRNYQKHIDGEQDIWQGIENK